MKEYIYTSPFLHSTSFFSSFISTSSSSSSPPLFTYIFIFNYGSFYLSPIVFFILLPTTFFSTLSSITSFTTPTFFSPAAAVAFK